MRIRGNKASGPEDLFDRPARPVRPTKAITGPKTGGLTRGIAALLIGAGFILGLMVHGAVSSPEPVSKPSPVPAVTKTVYRDKVVPRPTIPESCKTALNLINKLKPYMQDVMTVGQKQLDILSKAQVAIVTRNTADLVAAGTEQNKLLNSLSAPRREVNEQLAYLAIATDQCSEALSGTGG